MKNYRANKKGLIRYVLIGFLALPFLIFFLETETFSAKPYLLLPLSAPVLIIGWLYFSTSYSIERDELIYRSAFLKGKINIHDIREILKGKTMLVGVKPALGNKGLIVKYNKFDEIYIAPESNDEMVSDLLKINPEIKITE